MENIVCRYFVSPYGCKDGTNCIFPHETAGNRKPDTICRYFLAGKCAFGNQCWHDHKIYPELFTRMYQYPRGVTQQNYPVIDIQNNFPSFEYSCLHSGYNPGSLHGDSYPDQMCNSVFYATQQPSGISSMSPPENYPNYIFWELQRRSGIMNNGTLMNNPTFYNQTFPFPFASYSSRTVDPVEAECSDVNVQDTQTPSVQNINTESEERHGARSRIRKEVNVTSVQKISGNFQNSVDVVHPSLYSDYSKRSSSKPFENKTDVVNAQKNGYNFQNSHDDPSFCRDYSKRSSRKLLENEIEVASTQMIASNFQKSHDDPSFCRNYSKRSSKSSSRPSEKEVDVASTQLIASNFQNSYDAVDSAFHRDYSKKSPRKPFENEIDVASAQIASNFQHSTDAVDSSCHRDCSKRSPRTLFENEVDVESAQTIAGNFQNTHDAVDLSFQRDHTKRSPRRPYGNESYRMVNSGVRSEVRCFLCSSIIAFREREADFKYAVLENCEHIFCTNCIFSWKIVSRTPSHFPTTMVTCPVCARFSSCIVSTKSWFGDASEKRRMFVRYKNKMKNTPCKYFKQGNGFCSSGIFCLFSHATEEKRN